MRPNSRYDKDSRPSAKRPGKLVVAIIQPQTIRLRANRHGQTYATVRADVAFGNRTLERTVMVYAQSYPKFAPLLSPRRPLQVKLSRALVCGNGGRARGEFLIARSVVDTLEPPARSSRRAAGADTDRNEGPARTLSPHVRTGYYRRQRYGKGGQLVKIVWIQACIVNEGREREALTSARRSADASSRAQPRRGRKAPPVRAAAPEGWSSAAA